MGTQRVTPQQETMLLRLLSQAGFTPAKLDEIRDYQTTKWNYATAERIVKALNCYLMAVRLSITDSELEDLVYKMTGSKKRILWALNTEQVGNLYKRLVVMFSDSLHQQPARTAPKRYGVIAYKLDSVMETDSQKYAIDTAYYLEEGVVKVFTDHGEVVRLFYAGRMYEPVDLRD